ncbi:hypothetical protein KSP40_PGU008787 [Platanthera guangdongensis]|uniref:Uncharacterized protein n=1 Tax=Platanthera guangdongensis TaxID=2320717 RepID=A0ABR2LJ18_9ASPA
MVYVFYANANSVNGKIVIVRGKEINFSAAWIRDLFNLEDQGYDDYTEILNKVTLMEMTEVVCCTPTPEWVSKS